MLTSTEMALKSKLQSFLRNIPPSDYTISIKNGDAIAELQHKCVCFMPCYIRCTTGKIYFCCSSQNSKFLNIVEEYASPASLTIFSSSIGCNQNVIVTEVREESISMSSRSLFSILQCTGGKATQSRCVNHHKIFLKTQGVRKQRYCPDCKAIRSITFEDI